MVHERLFRSSPARVISALLQEVGTRGRVLGVGEFGAEVTFVCPASPTAPARVLVARARSTGPSTLVEVRRAEPGDPDVDETTVTALLDQVDHRLAALRSLLGPSAPPIAHGTLRPPSLRDAGPGTSGRSSTPP